MARPGPHSSIYYTYLPTSFCCTCKCCILKSFNGSFWRGWFRVLGYICRLIYFFTLYTMHACAIIGGSRGVPLAHAPPPPTGSNSFIFAYVFAEKHPCRRSALPQRLGAPQTRNPGSATGHI